MTLCRIVCCWPAPRDSLWGLVSFSVLRLFKHTLYMPLFIHRPENVDTHHSSRLCASTADLQVTFYGEILKKYIFFWVIVRTCRCNRYRTLVCFMGRFRRVFTSLLSHRSGFFGWVIQVLKWRKCPEKNWCTLTVTPASGDQPQKVRTLESESPARKAVPV